jgi:predicted DNA-binding protein
VGSPIQSAEEGLSHACGLISRIPRSSQSSAFSSTTIHLARSHLFPYPKLMEIHFAPETEKKLQDLAAQSGGKTADELVQDVIEGYFEELAQTRTMLNRRYDDLKSGSVKPIPGEEVEAYFRDKSAAARRSQPGS